MADAAPRRLEFIEGMRGCAALYVVVQHCCFFAAPTVLSKPSLVQPPWLVPMLQPFLHGHFAVAAFIVISGYCLMLARISTWPKFFARRCERILPPYYACLALSLVTVFWVTNKQVGLPWSQYVPVTSENLWAHVLMVHNLSKEWMYKINGVLWSISIEFQLYFIFPLLYLLIVKTRWALAVGLAALVAAVVLVLFPESRKLYVWFLPLFGLGMVGPKLANVSPKTLNVLALFGLLLAVGLTQVTKELWAQDIPMGLTTVCLLVLGHQNEASWVTKCFGKPWLAWVGGFSYSLYLVHHLILQWMVAYRPVVFDGNLRLLVYLLTLGVALSIFGSYLFFLAFEKPFLNRLFTGRKSLKTGN